MNKKIGAETIVFRLTGIVQFAGKVVRSLLDRLALWLAPAACASCDALLTAPTVFCSTCARTVDRADLSQPSFGQHSIEIAAATHFGGAVAHALNRLKHRDRPDLARPLGHLLRAVVQRNAHVTCIVPVPLHRVRLSTRMYNPAALLAREVARELNVRVDSAGLSREVGTRPQQQLSRRERSRNVVGAFVPQRSYRGESILLIDDVVTTGATLNACARALFAAGAHTVSALAVAVALEPATSPKTTRQTKASAAP